MQYILEKNKIIYKNVTDYDLKQTFQCGQTFRFDEYKDGFTGFIQSKPCYITLKDEILTVEILNGQVNDELAEKIGDFLALNMDYDMLKQKFSQDETLKKAIEYAPGIRVLNQDFFQTLITFIISQNNNIPRIKKLCDLLAEKYGTKVGNSFVFPTAQQMKDITEQDYKDMKFGFRAKYLADAVQKFISGEIDEVTVKSMSYKDAQKYLMQIKGVGPKVADCVLLFSCKQYESFPKDVWINRAMEILFPQGVPECCKGYEGIAQQYIFHYARFNL